MDKNKNTDEQLLAAQTAYAQNPGDPKLKQKLHDAQAEYVNEKLNSHLLTDLEKNKDWQGLLAIYEKLLTVFPESDRLKVLLQKVHKKIDATQTEERLLYFKEAQRQIQDMILKGELDAAEQATYEMLALDSNNHHFIHLLAHIQHLQDKVMDKLLTLYFSEATPQLKAEYKADKKNFIRV